MTTAASERITEHAAEMVSPQTLAAVDLGSNSFHMIVAQLNQDELIVVDRLRETVRLGAGLDNEQRLTDEAQERALACLERFGQRLRGLPLGSVRAVGTNTLRSAANADEFLNAAQAALGHPIDVIGGREEARLIYLGVAHDLEAGGERRLVVDIGGGSTEIISGRGFESGERESLDVGCVSVSQAYFPDGRLKRGKLRAAELEAELAIQPIVRTFRRAGWERVIGCSGTIRSIRTIVQEQGWCQTGITRDALDKLRTALLEAGHVDTVQLAGLAPDRRPVLPGGLAILWAVFDLLGMERMEVSDQALREGLLYDLIGRIHHTDIRERTVVSMMSRWAADPEHAERVKHAALALLRQVEESWKLSGSERADMLSWGALLHEIGLLIAHGSFHKHGAYVIANADLPGFSRHEQAVLAALVRGHRRKFPDAIFDTLPKPNRKPARRLCVLLRIAALLHRGRSDDPSPEVALSASADGVQLRFPPQWLEAHPLTRSDLERECEYLRAAGFSLEFC